MRDLIDGPRKIFLQIQPIVVVPQKSCSDKSFPYFPVCGLNTDIYSVNFRTQSIYGKIRTRENSVFGHFSYNEDISGQLFLLLKTLLEKSVPAFENISKMEKKYLVMEEIIFNKRLLGKSIFIKLKY